jgi:hypothetical protein
MVLRDETVGYVLRRTSGLMVPVQISGVWAVAHLGPPPDTWSELGSRSIRLVDEHAHGLTPAHLGKLLTGAALIPDLRTRRLLYELLPELPGQIRRQLYNALGVAQDPRVVPWLLPAALRADRVAAHALAGYPGQDLRPYLARLRVAAAQTADLDCRLWLAVSVAKQGDAGLLRSMLDEISPDSVPRALYGPTREVEARFRDVGRLPDEVIRDLAEYTGEDQHPRLGRRIAALLADEPEQEAAAPETSAAAIHVARQVAALEPNDAGGSRWLYERLIDLRYLPAHEVHGLMSAAVDLSFSPEPEVRWLARRAADLAARPDVVARDDLPVVDKALPAYKKALSQNVRGFVGPVVQQALGVGPADANLDETVEQALGDPDPYVQAQLFDVMGGSAAARGVYLTDMPTGPTIGGFLGGPSDHPFSGGPPGDPGGGPPDLPSGEPPDEPGGGPEEPGAVVYPRLEAPASVRPEATFTLTVGLQPTADDQLEQTGFQKRVSPDVHDLDISLNPGAFRLLDPLREHIHLVVTKNAPMPSTEVTLVAPSSTDAETLNGRGAVTATYFLDKQPLGTARRHILIGDATGDVPVAAETPPLSARTRERHELVDLTVQVHKRGELHVWSAIGPYTGSLSGGPDLENDASEAVTLITKIRDALDKHAVNKMSDQNLRLNLRGMLGQLRKAIPPKIWGVIGEAARAAQQAESEPPRIMLRSDDANLPWEAAWLGAELLVEAPEGARSAPYLGAQAVMGRYGETPGPLGAPPRLTAATVRVLAPNYELARDLEALGAAEDEAASVSELFDGADVQRLPDDHEAFLTLLSEGPHPDVLHVAAHGRLQAGQGIAIQGLPLLGDPEGGGDKYEVRYLEPRPCSGSARARLAWVVAPSSFSTSASRPPGPPCSARPCHWPAPSRR